MDLCGQPVKGNAEKNEPEATEVAELRSHLDQLEKSLVQKENRIAALAATAEQHTRLAAQGQLIRTVIVPAGGDAEQYSYSKLFSGSQAPPQRRRCESPA